MLAMMFLYPVNYGFDEPQHFDMAYAYAQGHGPYAPGKRDVGLGILHEMIDAFHGIPPSPHFADRPLLARPYRQSIAALGGDSQQAHVPNQMVQHPPLYYLLGAGLLDLPGVSSLAYDLQFSVLRFLSLVLLLPIPWLCFATARRLGAGQLAPAAAVVPLLLPALARAGAAVTNDSLMTLTGAIALYLMTRVVTGDARQRTATWLVVTVLAALLTKGFALILPLLAVLAYLVCWRRYALNVLRPLVTVCIGSVAGGIWWAHNYLAYGAIQPDGFGPGYLDRAYHLISPGPGGPVTEFLHKLVLALTDRFWGSIGLIESPDYNWTFVTIATVIMLGLIVVALVRGLGGPYGRAALVIPLLMAVLTVGLLVFPSWGVYHKYGLLAGAQGRYLYPAISSLAATAVLGLSRISSGRARRYVAPVLVGCAAYAQLWTLRTVVHAWWMSSHPVTTLSAWRNAIDTMFNWAPWPIGVTIVFAVLILAASGHLVYAAIRHPLDAVADHRPAPSPTA